jgi:hypothetical protein
MPWIDDAVPFSGQVMSQCMVAWKNACQPKEQGGLGIRNLATQNKCLLLKLLHRLHHPGDCAWARWIGDRVVMVSLQGDIDGAHSQDLSELLPPSIRHRKRGQWLTTGRLKESFPLLFNHMRQHPCTTHQPRCSGRIEPSVPTNLKRGPVW